MLYNIFLRLNKHINTYARTYTDTHTQQSDTSMHETALWNVPPAQTICKKNSGEIELSKFFKNFILAKLFGMFHMPTWSPLIYDHITYFWSQRIAKNFVWYHSSSDVGRRNCVSSLKFLKIKKFRIKNFKLIKILI